MGGNSFMTRLNREENDFYPTPRFAIDALLERESIQGGVWECACGDGAISEVLKEKGLKVYSTDLIDRGYGEIRNLDFLGDLFTQGMTEENIVTNPPFKLARSFIEKSLRVTSKKVCMLLRLAFLESADRYELFTTSPLKAVYVFSKRINFYPNGIKETENSGMVPFAWFVWEHGYKGEPVIRWIL